MLNIKIHQNNKGIHSKSVANYKFSMDFLEMQMLKYKIILPFIRLSSKYQNEYWF